MGAFSVAGTLTICGVSAERAPQQQQQTCSPGRLPPRAEPSCGLMIMTSFFTTKKDWQRGTYTRGTFSKMKRLYRSALRMGHNVTVIYDDLPEELLARFSCDRFRFARVDFSKYDRRFGVNDIRYFFFDDLLKAHPEWRAAFVVDAFDVRVAMNPCTGLRPDMLYVGSEQDRLKGHPWMKARFQKMGGQYNEWYVKRIDAKMKILNCGITGGHRDVLLRLFARMKEVLGDPAMDLWRKKKSEDINLNMAALNYIVYNEFGNNFAKGQPVHSVYKGFQKRSDVWFIHK